MAGREVVFERDTRIRRLRAEGLKLHEIATLVGLSTAGVAKALNRDPSRIDRRGDTNRLSVGTVCRKGHQIATEADLLKTSSSGTRCRRCREASERRKYRDACTRCGTPMDARRSTAERPMCRTCRNEIAVPYVSIPGHRKRAKHFGVPYEPINHRRVFDRDGWRCGICGKRIDQRRKYPDRRSATPKETPHVRCTN